MRHSQQQTVGEQEGHSKPASQPDIDRPRMFQRRIKLIKRAANARRTRRDLWTGEDTVGKNSGSLVCFGLRYFLFPLLKWMHVWFVNEWPRRVANTISKGQRGNLDCIQIWTGTFFRVLSGSQEWHYITIQTKHQPDKTILYSHLDILQSSTCRSPVAVLCHGSGFVSIINFAAAAASSAHLEAISVCRVKTLSHVFRNVLPDRREGL